MNRRLQLTVADCCAACVGAAVALALVLGVAEALLRRQVRR